MKTFILTILIMSISGFTAASDRYIRIDTHSNYKSIDSTKPIVVSGSGKALFEGNVVIRIEDMVGNKLVQVATTLKSDEIRGEGQWQTEITLPDSAPNEIKLIAFSPSPKEGDATIESKPVLLKTTGEGPENINWQLQQIYGESVEMISVLPETSIDARFSNGQISGSAGCNRYSGSYITGQNNHMTIDSKILVTRMACPPAISRQEQRYVALLPLVTRWQIQSDTLRLLNNYGQTILEYTHAKPIAKENVHW